MRPDAVVEGVQVRRLWRPEYWAKSSCLTPATLEQFCSVRNHSCLQVSLNFTRDDSFYFSTVFSPGIILVTSSFITFWLEWNAVPARVMIGVTTMLNFFTTSNSFRSTLPVVSNLSAMNVWDSVCMFFIYVSLLESVVVNNVGRKRPKHNMVYMPGDNAVIQRLMNDLKSVPPGRVIIFSDEKTWTVDPVRNRRNDRYLSLGEVDESACTLSTTKHPASLMSLGFIASNDAVMHLIWFPTGYRLTARDYEDKLANMLCIPQAIHRIGLSLVSGLAVRTRGSNGHTPGAPSAATEDHHAHELVPPACGNCDSAQSSHSPRPTTTTNNCSAPTAPEEPELSVSSQSGFVLSKHHEDLTFMPLKRCEDLIFVSSKRKEDLTSVPLKHKEDLTFLPLKHNEGLIFLPLKHYEILTFVS
ncbi:Neurotransmitter-gated ion-channel transmembrane domain [Trinorchestia longiramus]|nr:Neurotransmitter-gated ion-channel transmembrane domain [Trinorchestia longiramus]